MGALGFDQHHPEIEEHWKDYLSSSNTEAERGLILTQREVEVEPLAESNYAASDLATGSAVSDQN